MSRARGNTTRVPWTALAALAALLMLPAVAAQDASLQVEAPLIAPARLDVSQVDDGLVDVGIQAPLLPTASLDIPILGDVKSAPAPSRPQPAPAAGPAPDPTPVALPTAAKVVVGQATGAVAMGAIAASPAMPWETMWAAVANWFNQAREAARPAGRVAGRFLKALPFLAPLFTRIDGTRLLENPVRARVHEAISQDPGLSVQDVRDRAGVAWGTTIHHLARLERHGLVVSVRHGNHRRYFPANTVSSRHRRELSALSHPTAHRIAVHVTQAPGTDQKGICRALDLQNPAASKHLTRFEKFGLVQSEIVGRSRLYHPTDLLASVLATLESLGGLAPTPPAPVPAIANEERMPLRDALPELGAMMGPDAVVAN